jgi:hypothetical protein
MALLGHRTLLYCVMRNYGVGQWYIYTAHALRGVVFQLHVHIIISIAIATTPGRAVFITLTLTSYRIFKVVSIMERTIIILFIVSRVVQIVRY